MSVWKGSQLIAANGSPGNDGIPGPPGRDGINGNGVLVVDTCTEISNNVDAHGASSNTGHNYVNGNQHWCKVGGWKSGLGNAGQAADVFGYGCYLHRGSGTHVEGHGTTVGNATQGAHIEGYDNYVKIAGNGVHIEGCNIGDIAPIGQDIFANGIEIQSQGAHVEGCGHKGNLTSTFTLSDGAHIGGYGLTDNSATLRMPHQRHGYESTNIEVIGLKDSGSNGKVARIMRNDGCVGIAGDLAFTAVNSNGSDIGSFTLGEIVEALINAGILASPQ